MKPFTFGANVMAALALSLTAVVVKTALMPLLGMADAARVMLLVLSLGYLFFLLQRLSPRFGLALIAASWIAQACLLLLFNPSWLVWLLSQVSVLWLMRCALRYQHLSQWLADAVLNGLALCAGISVQLYSHSLGMSVWSYFLVLALITFIPVHGSVAVGTDAATSFHQSRRSAENALRRLQKNPV